MSDQISLAERQPIQVAEPTGPEGCEFYLASLGAFATYDPIKNPPPVKA